MSGKLRFRYALEPVLLTRQWDLDALMQTLAEQNAVIATHGASAAATQASIASAGAAWQAKAASGQFQSVDQFVLATAYMGDLSRQAREQAVRMSELVTERDELAERVVSAQRAVQAAEKHRDEMRAQFVQQRLSGEFKVADDQWNTLQSGAASNGI
jgi:serine phosphatase RsbU (regulator of sigma subunit)